ncbi:MAG: DUF4367 domain-containing protein [Clostridiaceae bacterium]|nr:DUF4367 domain-containing protein [Clostridiaceae bacterium]
MDRDYEKAIIEDDLDRLVRQAFGVDEDQLMHDFLLAQTEIREDQIPPEPEDGFDQLIKKMEERGIRPKYVNAKLAGLHLAPSSDTSQGEKTSGEITAVHNHKPRRLKTIIKVALIAAVLMAMVLGMGMTARARKRYTYNVTERELSGVDIIYNKGNITTQEDILSDAYRKIQEELGIDVLKLSYIPKDMFLEKVSINNTRAKMVFEYKGNYFYVIQQIRLNGSSFNKLSDRKTYKKIYNDWLKKDLMIEKNETETGENEFQIQIIEKDAYYSVEGIIEDMEFQEIAKNICLEIKNRSYNK